MDAPRGVRRDIEKKKGVASHAAEVDIHQLVHALDPAVLTFSPEPSRPDGDIGLGGYPVLPVLIAFPKASFRRCSRTGGIAVGIQGAPVGLPRKASFVTHPTAAGTDVTE